MRAKDAPRLRRDPPAAGRASSSAKSTSASSSTDADVLAIIEKMIKQRRDSIEQFEKARRQDLVDKEKAEIGVLQGYMPQRCLRKSMRRRSHCEQRKVMADMGK